MVINTSLCLSANVGKEAIPLKPTWGGHAYTIAAMKEFKNTRYETFDIDIEGERCFSDVDI